MVIKGAARRNSAWWTRHLLKDKENDRVSLIETRGVISTDLNSMMQEMKQAASLSGNCKNFMYIASFNPQAHEHPTEAQWERMLEIFETERGIPANQPRIVVEHEKKGRTHRHVIWQRTDLEKMRAFPDGLNPKICQQAAQKIELELGLERTPKTIDQVKDKSKAKGPKSWEMYRGMKTGIDPRDVQAEVTALLEQSENGQDFQAALERHGYELATGKRGLLILDDAGKEHSLARRCGLKAAELSAFMRDVDRQGLPTVEQAKAAWQERKIAHLEADLGTVSQEIAWEEQLARAGIEKEERERKFIEPLDQARSQADERSAADRMTVAHEIAWEEDLARAAIEKDRTDRKIAHFNFAARAHTEKPRPPHEIELQISQARKSSDSPKAFRLALAEQNISLARATRDDATQSQLESAEAKLAGKSKSTIREGEIVAVSGPGFVWKLMPRVTGDKNRWDIQSFLAALDQPLPSILEETSDRAREHDFETMRRQGRSSSHPRGQGMAQQQDWALDRVRAASEFRRKEEQRRVEETARKSSGEIDPARYLTDPDYRRQVKAERAYQTRAERRTARENEARVMHEQQDRQR